jgi:hypothetical protein
MTLFSLKMSMKKKLISCVLACATLCGADMASAQDFAPGVLIPESGGGFLIGPIGGINLVTYGTAAFPILNSEPGCFMAENGSGVAPFAGITAELPLGSGMQNFIILEAIYDSKSSSFSSDNANRTDVPTKVDGNTGPGNIETSVNADLSYMLINLGYKYNFVEGPAPVGPGLSLVIATGIKLASTLNKTVTVSAVTVSAVTGSSTVTESSEVDGASGIRLSLRPMFTYDIPLSSTWIATPTVGYDLPLTKVDDTAREWTAGGAWAGVAVRYFIQ